jgi:PAS domain S-box-containing protein
MKSMVKRMDEEEVLKILSEQSPVGVCIMQDGKFCYVNSNFPVAIGYTVDELVGKDSLEIVVPEDREMVMENTIKMLKGELLSPYQFRVTCKDGSIIWVMSTVKSIQYHGRRATLGNYMEITGRKQLEEALKEREEKYRELANSITDVFFAMDEHLRYTYWNKTSEILTGIREEDAIGKSLLEIFPDTPGIRKAEKVYCEVLRTQLPQTFVNDYDIDGRHYIFEISAYPSQGGIAVFVKDIAERKQAEDRLKESEQKYRLLFETSLDCIAQIDREGRYLTANPAVAKSLGVPLEELIGKTVFEVMPQEVAQYRLGNMRRVLDEWQPQIFEDERAGRYFYHIVIPTKISEHKEAVQVITRDITERKKMEEALRQSEENYKTLFNSSVIGMYVMDVETMKVVIGNQAAREMTGFSSAEEGIGVNPFDLVVPEDREKVLEIAINEFLQESRRTHEIQVMDKNGRRKWHSISIARIMYKDRPASLVSFTDITERKQAEEKLKESEQKYRTILEEMGDGYFETDLAGNLTFVNDALIRILGYSTEELIGMNFRALRPKEEAKAVFKAYNHMYKTGEPLRNLFTEIICKDGRHIFAETSAFPIINDKGEIVGFRGTRRDITERKQAEEALRQSEERYRTILEEMEDSYFEVDLGGHLTFVNNSVCRDLGYSKEELIRMSYKDLTVEEDIESVFRVFNEVYRTGVPNKGFPWRTTRKDGSHGFAETSVSPLRNDKGEIIGFRGVGRDVSERKQVEEALRRSEERYRTILEEMEDSYFEVDLGGHITFVNNSVCRDLGYSREELIEMSYKGFTIEDDIESVFRVFNEVYRTGVPNKGFPWKTIRKDGSHGFAETSVSSLRNSKGEIIGFRGVGRDITERKQVEEKLRQSRENYRALFDSSVIGALVIDADTMRVVMGNQAAVKMFGFSSAKEGAGVNPLDFVPLGDREKSLERIVKEVFGKDSRKSVDIQAVTKDGREIWLSVTGARIMHKGRLAGLFSFTDITERKQAEEKLRQSEENYKTLFNSSVIGMYVLDAETMQVVMGNRAAVEMAGFSSAGNGIGINPLDFVIPEDRAQILEMATKEFEQDLRRTHEVRVIAKDGGTGWISISSARIMHKGRLAALVSITNITERKKMEEALRQSEENYRALFDSSVIGTVLLDAETRKTVMANQAAAKIFGLSSPQEGIGRNPLDFVPPEDREMVIEVIRQDLFEQDVRRTAEFRAVTKNGREIWLSVTAARIMHEGKLAGLVSFVDITEQKRQSERLMMTDRLASLGELASGTAHELNNPLTSIIGFSQLLMEREVPDDIREDLKLINNEAQRAASVTKNLLTFARKHAPVKQRNQINNIIEDVLKLRAYEHRANGIEVERQLGPDLPEIMVDYFQMQQVFMNIIINAEYFMIKEHNKGTLTITTQKQNNTVMISIADNGPGIPPENLRRIFDPFFTTKEAGKGTGLGLSICHGIVTEHGGQIYARNQPGKGATFFVELPISR